MRWQRFWRIGPRGDEPPDSLASWNLLRRGVTSELAAVECLRTLARLRLAHGLADEELATRRAAVYRIPDSLEVAGSNAAVLARASDPFPTALGTLDAIHLATALLHREGNATAMTMATPDLELAIAARACGLNVIG